MARTQDAHFDQYLKEIRQTPLLTAAEEVELALRIRQGDAESRERMIKANLRLVVTVAKEFLNRGLPFMDLIAEGNIGLMRAIEKFEPGKGNRFSTYGIHWIKQSIRRALSNSAKTVRVPTYMLELVSEFKQKSAQMAAANGGQAPDPQAVADAIGLTEEQFELLRSALNSGTRSTDSSSGDTAVNLSERIADKRAEDPSEALSIRNEIQLVSRFLNSVEERHATILRMRYGIGNHQPMTLSEIGDKLGLTRERIRQLENEAIASLHELMTQLRGYKGDY